MRSILLFLLVLPLFSQAQETLLFEISKPGKPTSYLFGTMHVQDEVAFNFGDSVFWAIDQVETVALEADLSPKGIDALDKSMFEDVFQPEDIENFGQFLQEKVMPKVVDEVPVGVLMSKLRDEVLPTYMELISRRYKTDNRTLMVDMYLQNYANSKGKETVGIETYAEQFKKILEGIKQVKLDDKLADKIVSSLKEENWVTSIASAFVGSEDLIEAYSEFDLENICDMMEAELNSNSTFSRMMYQKILIERNDIMFERTLPQVKERSTFIGVGSGHLCGKNGLIEQYIDEGYSVRAMEISEKSETAIVWEQYQGDGFSIEVPKGVEELPGTGSDMMGAALLMKAYSDEATSNVIYTSKGMASFDVALVVESEDDYMDMYLKMLEGMNSDNEESQHEDQLELAVQHDTEITEEIEEMVVVDDPELPEPPAPEIVDDVEIEEVVEEVGVDIAIEEVDDGYSREVVEYEVTETEIEDIVHDEDVSYENYQNDRSVEPNPFSRRGRGFKENMTEKQMAYFEELKDSIEGSKEAFMGVAMSAMTMFTPETDTMSLEINGVETPVYYSSSLLGKSLEASVTVDDYEYQLTINGDPEVLKSKEVLRFFTSFKPE